MSSERFKCFNGDELLYLYRALSAFIDAGNGIGFHNCDRGHPDYVAGAAGLEKSFADADDATNNALFKLGHELHDECIRRSPEIFSDNTPPEFIPPFSDWKSFCQAAVEAHQKHASV